MNQPQTFRKTCFTPHPTPHLIILGVGKRKPWMTTTMTMEFGNWAGIHLCLLHYTTRATSSAATSLFFTSGTHERAFSLPASHVFSSSRASTLLLNMQLQAGCFSCASLSAPPMDTSAPAFSWLRRVDTMYVNSIPFFSSVPKSHYHYHVQLVLEEPYMNTPLIN